MKMLKTIEIKQSVFADNDRKAEELRADLKNSGIFLLNLMSSPGSGKTTTLLKTIEALGGKLRVGVIEADIDSDVDAYAVQKAGARAVQLHTGGMFQLNAEITPPGLDSLGGDHDQVVVEKVGNQVSPPEFDTGASKNAMILSVPEGDDKPLKYPLMFTVADVLLINKIDVAPYFDFDMDAVCRRARARKPGLEILPVSARTGEGIDRWAGWLLEQVAAWKGQ